MGTRYRGAGGSAKPLGLTFGLPQDSACLFDFEAGRMVAAIEARPVVIQASHRRLNRSEADLEMRRG